jgi:hypothetical protein
MPFAPVTMAVKPLISFEKVGRFLNMPLSCKGRDLDPILTDIWCDGCERIRKAADSRGCNNRERTFKECVWNDQCQLE